MEKTFIQIGKNRIFKKNCFRLLISNVLFCFAFLISLISCSNITKQQDYATVSVSLLNINAKTISPVPANSYESVNSWTITFCDDTAELDDLIFNNISFSQNSVQTLKIPFGSYTAKIEGFSSEVSGLVFTDSKTFSVSNSDEQQNLVFSVSPKKIASGYFEANFTFSSRATDFSSTATLTSIDGNGIFTLNSSVSYDETNGLYKCKVSSINMQDNQILPSGFYLFSLKISYSNSDGTKIENQEIYAENNDFLIEICDDVTTTIEKQLELPAVIQNIYVTQEATKGNGSFETFPINYNEALSKSFKNITKINFIFVDVGLSEIPEIDVSKIKGNCIYQFVFSDNSGYEISNQTENFVLAIQNVAQISLFDSTANVSKSVIIESISETSTFQDISILTELEILLAESLSADYELTINENGKKTVSKRNTNGSGNGSGGTGNSTENSDISTPVMMYTEGTDNYNVYYATFETLTETETGTNVFSSSDCDTFENVSVDSSNNIYISYANNNHFIKKITCTVQDGKYQYDNGTTYQVNPSVSHSVYSIGQIKLVNETFYMFDEEYDKTNYNTIYHLLKGTYATDYTNITATEISYETGFDTVMAFCVSADETKVYTYETTADYSYYYLNSYTITKDSNNSASLTSDKSLLLASVKEEGLFNTNLGCAEITVNDMFFKDNSIYLLIDDDDSTHSRGGILKINTTDITDTSNQSTYCFPTVDEVTSENDSQYFYSPKKIVGIGEDYILIEDKTTSTSRIVKYSLTNNSIVEFKNTKY